jgi:hypothetical protein
MLPSDLMTAHLTSQLLLPPLPRLAALLLAAALQPGCGPAPHPAKPPAAAPALSPAPEAKNSRWPEPAPDSPVANGSQPAVPSPPEQPHGGAFPARLVAEFRQTADEERRSEIIDDLWEQGTPGSIDGLRQLFITTHDEDLKQEILSGALESPTPASLESVWTLLFTATGPSQPAPVRELAADLLADFDEPRAISLLRSLSQDSDASVREAAQAALEAQRDNENR